MNKVAKISGITFLNYTKFFKWITVVLSLVIIGTPVAAQQTGSVGGRVLSSDGAAVADVTIVATSPVLPQSRSTTSSSNGRYQLPLLPPGDYQLAFTFPDGSKQVRNVFVPLQRRIKVDVSGRASGAVDEIVVTAARTKFDAGRANLADSINNAAIEGLPVGQEYRDLQKLIPGVQFSQDTVRGPSAGGSGQDNIYLFDGVDVSLPLFGTLSSEPSTHDIEQVSIVRGGATAIGFNRTGGFLINSTSKRGTNEFHGEVKYQFQSSGFTSDITDESNESFNEDKTWLTASLGGPILKDKLFFYTSYYRPTVSRDGATNAYGDVPGLSSSRDEYFGKLTFAPTDNVLLDASYRTSDRSVENRGVGEFEAASTSSGDEASLDIITLEGSWVVDDDSSLSIKFTDFRNKTSGRPDTLFDFETREGVALDVSALDQQGQLAVPTLIAGEDAYNAFVQPLIDQYGYIDNGVATGGGSVGGNNLINNQDFSRTSFEIAYDRQFHFGDTTHNIHIGYQYQDIQEDLARLSNGWGNINVIGGRSLANDGVTPIFYEARINQQSLLGADGVASVPTINSRSVLQSFEINDTIEMGELTFNIGALISNDTLYGQGLRENSSNLSGFELAPGNRYKMYEVDWGDMIQPRFGVNWDYSDTSSVYANYSRYNPSASSLARAASWDRNLARTIRVYFDADGNFIESDPVRSSSGKVFQEGLKPRKIDEYLVGWTSQVSNELTLRAHARYREGANFWEDTGNADRINYGAGVEGIPQELYVPNLDDIRAEIGGSSFVIAQLDTAYTKYWEVSAEAAWNRDNLFVSGSYTWSHYYGNFDQDNTTTANDANTFIGSSLIADGAGRQLWNFRDGDLRGDRRHIFKLYGYYQFDWDGQFGAFFLYQSGQPWEAWDVEVYRDLTGSTSDTSRLAEPAGSRRTGAHTQLDLNYTQNFKVFSGYTIQLRADLFNVFNKQTGYNIQSKVNSAGFGTARDFFNPRRLQLSIKAAF